MLGEELQLLGSLFAITPRLSLPHSSLGHSMLLKNGNEIRDQFGMKNLEHCMPLGYTLVL